LTDRVFRQGLAILHTFAVTGPSSPATPGPDFLRHSAEIAFYVSNTPVTATRAAQAIRAHWKIETTSH
jgi:hypothetical protein